MMIMLEMLVLLVVITGIRCLVLVIYAVVVMEILVIIKDVEW